MFRVLQKFTVLRHYLYNDSFDAMELLLYNTMFLTYNENSCPFSAKSILILPLMAEKIIIGQSLIPNALFLLHLNS